MSGLSESTRRFPRRPILIGPIDRDVLIAQLCEHFCSGRLTLAEFETRVESALVAYTDARLAELVEDLPDVPVRPVAAATTQRPSRRRLESFFDQLRVQLLGHPGHLGQPGRPAVR